MGLRKLLGRMCRALVRWQERKVEQESIVMWRSLEDLPPLELPPFVEIVTMDQHYREEDLLDIHNEACAGMKGFRKAGRVQLEAFKASPLHDPKGVLIARIEGVAVGYCFARYAEGAPGKITGLAVLSGYRQRGIGRALLLGGLWYLREKGADRARLLADRDDPAMVLYEGLGFSAEEPRRSNPTRTLVRCA